MRSSQCQQARASVCLIYSFLLLLVRHLLLVAMHLLLIASCYYYNMEFRRESLPEALSWGYPVVRREKVSMITQERTRAIVLVGGIESSFHAHVVCICLCAMTMKHRNGMKS